MDYLLDNLELSSLTKAELAEKLTDLIGLSNREARDIVEGFFEIVSDQLVQGGSVKLAGFGNFSILEKKARPGRNLHTGEAVEVKARRTIRFQTGPKLRKEMWQPSTPPENNTPESTAEKPKTTMSTSVHIKSQY